MISNQIQEYYDSHAIFKLRDFAFGNLRIDAAIRFIDACIPDRPFELLDIGCGIGTAVHKLSKSNLNGTFCGADISAGSVEIAKRLFGNNQCSFVQISNFKDLELKLGNRLFDIITLVDVFEHIKVEDRPELFQFLLKYIKADGQIILTCPTPEHLDYLRSHNPVEIQPVDENISFQVLNDLAISLQIPLAYYSLKSIRFPGDYFHVVFSRRPVPELTNYQRPIVSLKDKLKYRVRKIFKRKRIVSKPNPCLKLIEERLGLEAVQKLITINGK